ncbi:MAG: FprA family A-type flavoprotein [Clostridiales bacterium]|nr:FprA family A-type flavoprotein [Clostridiales bacterium]
MKITKIAEDIYQLKVNMEGILFEGLWEMPNGVSLNSYIVKGEKTALIDGVCGWDGVPESLIEMLNEMEIAPKSIEYLIINHTEPDHSGWIEDLKKVNSTFKIVCSKKAKELLAAFYGHTEDIICIEDVDSLDLGKGHVLSFTSTPNVHWPDTMVTMDNKTGVLFTCDMYGSFGITEGKTFDDELSEEEHLEYENETIRYYSNIMGAFSPQVEKAVKKSIELSPKIIAPAHGLVWRSPEIILKAYGEYAECQKGLARNEITLIWGSMYGMTEKAVRYVEELLEKKDIKVHVHRVPEDSWGTILTSAWTSKGIILAMPTYEFKMFPPMAAALEELGKKKVFNRKSFRFGSYGWSGGAQRELDDIMTKLKMNWEFLDPVEFLGSPREKDLELIGQRIEEFVEQIKR